MIMGSAALPLLIFLPFFHIRAFLIQWTRLPQSLEQASQLILREHLSFFRMAKLKKSHNFFPSSYRPPRAFYVSITFTDIFIKILSGSLCGGESVLRGSSQTSAESTGKKRRPIIAHSLIIWEMHFGP